MADLTVTVHPSSTLALTLAIDALSNEPPVSWPVNWESVVHGLRELKTAIEAARTPPNKEAQHDHQR